MAGYKTEAEALASAGVAGWTVTGREPEYQSVPNPNRATTSDPATIQQRTGNTVLTVQSADGKQKDTVTVGEVDDPDVKGGKAITVVKGAQKNQPAGNAPSEPGGWTPVYRVPGDPSSGQIGQWDPKNNEFHPQAADPNAKPSGTYTNVIDPNDPNKKRVIGMVDTGDASWHAVSSDPNLPGRQIITTPTAVYAVDAQNNVSKLVDIDKDSPFQAVIVDGKPFKFDPKNGTFTSGPVTAHPDIKDQNGLPMVWQGSDTDGKYGYPAGVKPAAGLSVNTQAQQLVWYDTEGNIVAQRDNPNYRPPAPTLPQVGANAPNIPIEDPEHPGQIKWVPNQGQVMAGEALQQLAAQLTHTVVDPSHPLTMDQAKALIDTANAKITSDIAQQNATTAQQQNIRGAASDIIQSQTQGATTGASLINQRVAAAQGMLGQVLGLAGQGQALGGLGGGLHSVPAGLGEALVGGIQGFTADLGGGQAVYDTAARLVQQADPQNGRTPEAQAAYGVLTQMLQKYQDTTGQPHPAVAATQAAMQSQAANGFTPPSPQLAQPAAPAVFQAQYDPRFTPAAPQQNYATQVLPAGVAGTVSPNDPRFGRVFTAPPMVVAPEAVLPTPVTV